MPLSAQSQIAETQVLEEPHYAQKPGRGGKPTWNHNRGKSMRGGWPQQSFRHRPYGRTAAGARGDDLIERYNDVTEDLHVAREALQTERRVFKDAIRAVEQELDDARSQAASLARELEAVKAFTSTQEPDVSVLLKGFESLNKSVVEFALNICRSLDPTDLIVTMHRSSVDVFILRHEAASALLSPILTRAADAGTRVQDVIAPVVQCVLHSALLQNIFRPFAPSLARTPQSQYLYTMRTNVYNSETQESGARWRALTYRALIPGRDDGALATHIATQTMELLGELLRAILPPGFEPEALYSSESTILSIALSAMRWQDLARGIFTSADYDAFLPLPGEIFMPSDMHPVELLRGALGTAAQAAQKVLLPVSLGLRATSMVEAGDERRTRLICKANVVGVRASR
ncbi:hypothetical protein BKA62DRAFT_805141 [Auriculariales sp. MPI-PUGE-AT-0066]|nr:hypothetical protein BKA62DRAFT_805141 [Auriculariales sp. MPI-PUGE-AT-0066]